MAFIVLTLATAVLTVAMIIAVSWALNHSRRINGKDTQMTRNQVPNFGVPTIFIDLDNLPPAPMQFKVGDEICLYRVINVGGHMLTKLDVPNAEFAMAGVMFTTAPLRVAGQPAGSDVRYLGSAMHPGKGVISFELTPMAPGYPGQPHAIAYVVS